ncbi:polysaccharide deacetylase family protein [Phnomibacter ginsenosidimutans]|uniref:Polysaccharide deacetylase family protein n=1 Tax=Phnomibacter ginsenosidimutans TaxID=2676868 RepID=A0A6I6GAV2_9BACT|nr:polysaccharide deacetylase family protein [Phnomibacter ginsenosidimutans]QGW28773.1 polysaccharide deacetylase family protein [Phnomibacter ginsenosidimutans]
MKVIMYHYVRPHTDFANNKSVLPLDVFNWQLDFFSKTGSIIHPADLFVPDFQPEPHQYLLTFDDGLIDHYTHVFPALQQRGLSGLFFLNGKNFVENRLLNVHRLHYLLANCPAKTLETACLNLMEKYPLVPAYKQRFEASVYEGLQQEEIISDIKARLNFFVTPQDQDSILEQLLHQFGFDEKPIMQQFYLNQSQASDMQQAGMYFGAHGYSHYVMSNLPVAKQQSDIDQSIHFLQQWLPAHQPLSFCYPYGYHNSYDEFCTSYLQQQTACAFAVENRPLSEADWTNNRWALPRIDCNRFLPD